VTTERLLGSYLVRVSQSGHERRIAVHSVLTGERRQVAGFAELAAYLAAATEAAARGRADAGPAMPRGDDAGAGEAEESGTGSERHGR
jgi:hypothetical protein